MTTPQTLRDPRLLDRLWGRVRKSEGCWEWTASTGDGGYGRISIGDVRHQVTRVVWEVTFGPIPAGMLVCHSCDNPPCVRPDHLFLGTQRENMKDAGRKGRLSLGHPRKLTVDQLRELRAAYDAGASPSRLAPLYDVSVSHAYRLATRKSRKVA